MSINCYQIAYENAIDEIAEINAQVWTLTSRKELLERLLEPLRLLVPDSGYTAIPVGDLDNLNAGPLAADAAAHESPVAVLLDVSPSEDESFEAPIAAMSPEAEESNIGSSRNGGNISHEGTAALAYRYWNERGQAHGHHEEDWFRAVRELQDSAA